jgi:hypothetical protein
MRQRVAAAAQLQKMPGELMLADINTDFPGIYVIARLGQLSILTRLRQKKGEGRPIKSD